MIPNKPDIQNKPITIDILKQIPKAELHRHLDGSIRISSLIELAKEQKVELPSYDVEELSKYILKDKDCKSLDHFLEAFQYTCKVLQHAYAITRVFYEMCEDAINDGVTYLEVRFSPILHTLNGLSLSEVMEAVCDGLAMAELNLSIKARVIVCGLRHLDPSVTKDLAEIAWRYRHKGVVAFDLAGSENQFPSKYHKEAFSIIRNKGINCTLHSGEDSDWTSVSDSLHYCGAHRIGHGIAIQQNEELLNFVSDRRVPIECCITSNVQIKALPTPGHHPIRKYFDRGAVVSLACDNVTMSNVTLSGEYKLAIDTFDFSVEETLRLVSYSFSSSFIDPPIKQNICRESIKKAIKIFQINGYCMNDIVKNRNYYFEEFGLDVELEINNNNKLEKSTTLNLPITNFSLGKDISSYLSRPVTLDLLKNLPKSDLHTRFDGSVSIEQMWFEMKQMGIDQLDTDASKNFKRKFGLQITNIDQFRSIIQNPHHTPETIQLSKQIMNTLLQNTDQINRAFDDIIKVAISDNIQYMELLIRPNSHIKKGLGKEQVLQLIIDNKNKWEATGKIKIGIVVFSSSSSDDPIETLANAKLAIENKSNGVVGFGIFGKEPILPNEIKHFSKTFNLLKESYFNLVQFNTNIESIISTLHEAGANRLSGAFLAHKIPRLMSYLGAYRIPVEISLTDKLKSFTNDLSFTTPIRHLLDNKVPVVICSFRSSLYKFTRSEMLYEIVKNGQLDIKHVIALLKNPFAHNFQSKESRSELVDKFNQLSKNYLDSINYDYKNIFI
ncbi:hypothetical protein DICPUDRAFT_54735 [Dictyostelium purpureum]|uniref:adenosine deaminase n=1 Tax=Dictyostelium purpureum TaxID=5786 RepID=F0ZIH8_DICPU|nr:uncharacterized protein DICPUDRAFT_54735 [Dictyostelium purpureum]EGC36265.1 hypothetical protein DICPUDRAFT_54735 [Dictyostelium purpureum]|eukprot:XP_003287211.1 hypothetical protein DICPUDRAFT_54735 [Dictyostelium purpureum]